MGIGDIRYTVLQAVNEVQRKLGLDATGTLTANKLATEMVDYINDVCDDLSDFGDWQETLVTANVTAISSAFDYTVSTSANIKNIGDVYFTGRRGPLRNITVEQMRILARVTSRGTPTQFTVFGTDNNGNPNLRVRPIPTSADAGKLFSILYYTRSPRYTTNDASLVVPFPARVVVKGVLAKVTLGESGGSPTDKYTLIQNEYLQMRKEALNRFNGDTGWNVAFAPSRTGRRRR